MVLKSSNLTVLVYQIALISLIPPFCKEEDISLEML